MTININYPDALPEMVEQECVSLIEAGLSGIKGVNKIYSRSNFGSGSIEIGIEDDVALDYFRFEVANMIRQIAPALPESAGYPVIKLSGIEKQVNEAILVFSVFADDTKDRISTFARDRLIPELALVEGFQKLELVGNEELEWVISYDPEKMTARNMDVRDIGISFARHVESTPLSLVKKEDAFLPLVLSGMDGQSLNKLLVGSDSIRVPLSEIADVKMDLQTINSAYRINGQSNIRIRCIPEPSANHLKVAGNMRKKLGEVAAFLPPGYQVLLEYDQTEFLTKELNRIKVRSLLSLSMILIFVLIVYRDFRKLLIIFSALLVNLGLACIGYSFFEVGINLYALAAVTISFGIMIDNALIMVHHLKFYRDLSVFQSLLSATLTTMASLIVIFFLPDLWKENLSEFSKVIIINLSISLLVSLLFVPALLHRFGGIASEHKEEMVKDRMAQFYHRVFGFISRFRKGVIAASILLFGIPVFLLPSKIKEVEWYNSTIGSDLYQEKIRPIVDKVLGGSFRLFHRYVYENGNFRNNAETFLYANAKLPDGSKMQQADDLARSFESFLNQYYSSKVKNYFLTITGGERINIRITFADASDYIFPYQLKNELTAMAVNLGGAQWNIYGVGRGFSNGFGAQPPQFRLKLKGYNLDKLRELTADFAELLQTNPRVNDMDTEANMEWYLRERFTYELQYDERILREQKFSPGDVQSAFQMFNPRRAILGYTEDNVRVSLINSGAKDQSIWNVKNEVVPSGDRWISLREVANYTKREEPMSLHKEDQQYIQLMQWVYTGSSRFGHEHLKRIREAFEPTLPLGYAFEEMTNSFFGEKSKQQFGLLFLVVVLIYMICAVHFESLKLPLSIILFIPLSYVGIFLTFYYFDFSFDQGGFTSFILVGGITVNSMIIILNDYMRFLQRGEAPLYAYALAFRGKITPVILTVISTIVGLIPFLMFGDNEPFWFALAVGSIGGLFFSIFALVFIMPAFVGMKRA